MAADDAVAPAQPQADHLSAPAPPQKARWWHRIGSWQGSGAKETEVFDVASSEWRLVWTSKPVDGAGYLSFTVCDESGGPVALAVNQTAAGADTTYVHTKPGRYYISANAANTDWSVSVEDQR